MYGKLRRLKIQEPQSEDFALRTGALGSDKRVENDTNLKPAPGWNLPARSRLEFEHTERSTTSHGSPLRIAYSVPTQSIRYRSEMVPTP